MDTLEHVSLISDAAIEGCWLMHIYPLTSCNMHHMSDAQHLYLCKHKHSNRERSDRPERRGVIIQLTISLTHWHCGPTVWIGVGFTARSSPICGWYTFISNNKLHIALFTLHHSGLFVYTERNEYVMGFAQTVVSSFHLASLPVFRFILASV